MAQREREREREREVIVRPECFFYMQQSLRPDEAGFFSFLQSSVHRSHVYRMAKLT